MLELIWTRRFRTMCERLYEAAVGHAKRLAEQASARSAGQLAAWLQDVPARGLRRQHQLSRTAAGWIPTKRERIADYDDGEETVDVDGFDGLSAEELASVLVTPEPLSAEQCAESECNRWAGEWLEAFWVVVLMVFVRLGLFCILF